MPFLYRNNPSRKPLDNSNKRIANSYGTNIFQNLAIEYLIKEGAGSRLNDSSGFQNHLYATIRAALDWSGGAYGNAFEFPPSGGYKFNNALAVSPKANNLLQVTDFSMEALIYLNNTSLGEFIFELGADASNYSIRFEIFDPTAGNIAVTFSYPTSGALQGSQDAILVKSAWNHIIITGTYTDDPTVLPLVTIYLNGSQYTTTNQVSGIGNRTVGGSQAITLGSDNATAASFINKISHFRFWTRILQPGEVSWLYSNPYAFEQTPLWQQKFYYGIPAASPAGTGVGSWSMMGMGS